MPVMTPLSSVVAVMAQVAGEGLDVRAEGMVSNEFYVLGDVLETPPPVVSDPADFPVLNLSCIANVDQSEQAPEIAT